MEDPAIKDLIFRFHDFFLYFSFFMLLVGVLVVWKFEITETSKIDLKTIFYNLYETKIRKWACGKKKNSRKQANKPVRLPKYQVNSWLKRKVPDFLRAKSNEVD